MSGTDVAYAASAESGSGNCLTERCYAMCGTEMGYALRRPVLELRTCLDGHVITITEPFGQITDGNADYNANMAVVRQGVGGTDEGRTARCQVCTFIIAPDQSTAGCDGSQLELT
eukprot:2015880-Rhodomonas_salina.7